MRYGAAIVARGTKRVGSVSTKTNPGPTDHPYRGIPNVHDVSKCIGVPQSRVSVRIATSAAVAETEKHWMLDPVQAGPTLEIFQIRSRRKSAKIAPRVWHIRIFGVPFLPMPYANGYECLEEAQGAAEEVARTLIARLNQWANSLPTTPTPTVRGCAYPTGQKCRMGDRCQFPSRCGALEKDPRLKKTSPQRRARPYHQGPRHDRQTDRQPAPGT